MQTDSEVIRQPSRTLEECEAVIGRGLRTFLEVGEALLDIRDGRLYRETHDTFEAYCRERWNFNRHRASQLISAADVVTTVTIEGIPGPSSERVARALVPCRDWPPELLCEIWRLIVDEYGLAPTSTQVREYVAEFTTSRPIVVRLPSSESQAIGRANLHHKLVLWDLRQALLYAIEAGVLIQFSERRGGSQAWKDKIPEEDARNYVSLAAAYYVAPTALDARPDILFTLEDAYAIAREVPLPVDLPDWLPDLRAR